MSDISGITEMEHYFAKTRQQIADEYGICTKTLLKWLKNEKIYLKKGLIDPKTQLLIYNTFGDPKEYKKFR